jgi:hypothetical protein
MFPLSSASLVAEVRREGIACRPQRKNPACLVHFTSPSAAHMTEKSWLAFVGRRVLRFVIVGNSP